MIRQHEIGEHLVVVHIGRSQADRGLEDANGRIDQHIGQGSDTGLRVDQSSVVRRYVELVTVEDRNEL